jgi:septal ring factor EnvC (AmiA/AmiB activator)
VALVIAAVIALSLLSGALAAGMIWAFKTANSERAESKAAADLYRKQQEITLELETERRELTSKLKATDEQLREATIRLEKTEQQRNQALAEAREAIRKEIRSAPDAIAALNRVIANGPGVQRSTEAKAETAAAEPDPGSGGSDPLLITDLR